jgi:ubiquinone/menaquinone biosynthesis C-methylase UbiE
MIRVERARESAMSAEGSISFDRAAGFYDATRLTAFEGIEDAVAVLGTHLPERETILEIGVGTGALALPLAGTGRNVVGIDLSEAMLGKLEEKDREGLVHLVLGDATALPFGEDAFGGAYCRWVFHLITEWAAAVRELCRAVRPGGTILVHPGGYSGEWRVVWRRMVDELGPDAEPLGLDITRGEGQLDDAFAAAGATPLGTAPATAPYETSLARFFDEAAQRVYSWTWRVSDDALERAIVTVRLWAEERYGDLDGAVLPLSSHDWRIYRVDPPSRA